MSDPTERDAVLTEYLKGDSALSRAYRDASDELPPAHVDARILSEARRADAPMPVAPGPFSSRWMVPASLAVMLMAVSVVALLPPTEHPLIKAPDVADLPVTDAAVSERANREAAAERTGQAEQEAPGIGSSAGRRDVKKLARPFSDDDAARSSDATSPSKDGEAIYRLPAESLRAPAVEESVPFSKDALAPPSTVPAAPAASIMGEPMEGLVKPDAEADSLRQEQEAAARQRLRHQPEAATESKIERQTTGERRISGSNLSPEPQSAPAISPSRPATTGKSSAMAADASARLERISMLIDIGALDAAANELRTFEQLYPEMEIPPAIVSALKAVDR